MGAMPITRVRLNHCCPACRHPVGATRWLWRSWIWARWNCASRATLLRFDIRSRLRSVLSCTLLFVSALSGASAQAQDGIPGAVPEIGETREVALPAGGGKMTTSAARKVLGETDPRGVYPPGTQELKKVEPAGLEGSPQFTQVMKYPLSHRGANPFVTVAWVDDPEFEHEDGQGLVDYLLTARIPPIGDFYGEINIKIPPKKFESGAVWSFEAKLPEKVADWSGWRGKDYVREYIIHGESGFWIVSAHLPKEGQAGAVEAAREVDAILKSIPALKRVFPD